MGVKRKEPNKSMKDRLSKKARLSKYRRKSANAKERERMKRQNDVFEVLKEILPCDKAKRSDEEKETKVTTLRSAIAYINSLQSLLDDCEAGRLDSSLIRQCSLSTTTTTVTSRKKKKSGGSKRKPGSSSPKEKVVEPKWTHYSKQDLRTKFEPKNGVNMDINTGVNIGNLSNGDSTTIGILPSAGAPPFTLTNIVEPGTNSTTSSSYQLPTAIFCEAPNMTDYQCTNSGSTIITNPLQAAIITNSPTASSPPTVFSSTPSAPNSGTSSVFQCTNNQQSQNLSNPTTVYQCTTNPTTTYLCPPTTVLLTTNNCNTTSNDLESMVETSPPSYIYATTTSPNLIFTEGEVMMATSSPNSSCSIYSPVQQPSSPRDVNEISLHISLLDTRTPQLVTF